VGVGVRPAAVPGGRLGPDVWVSGPSLRRPAQGVRGWGVVRRRLRPSTRGGGGRL